MKEKLKVFSNGLLKENPSLRLVLGTCPTLAVTTAGRRTAWAWALRPRLCWLCSNIAISALRKIIPDKVRLPAVHHGHRHVCDGTADAGEGVCACAGFGAGHLPAAHRGELHHPGPCRDVRFQEQHRPFRRWTAWAWVWALRGHSGGDGLRPRGAGRRYAVQRARTWIMPFEALQLPFSFQPMTAVHYPSGRLLRVRRA